MKNLKAGQVLKVAYRDSYWSWWRDPINHMNDGDMVGRCDAFYLVEEDAYGEKYARAVKVENYGRSDMTYTFDSKKRIPLKKVIDCIVEIWEADSNYKMALVWNGLKTISNSQASITYQIDNLTAIDVKFANDCIGKTVDLNDIVGSDVLERIFNQITGPCPDVIILPKNIKEIGEGVFCNSHASKIVLPEGAEKIGAYAFLNSHISQVEGFNIKEVEREIFMGCKNLSTLTWSPRCCSIPDGCFKNSGLKRIYGTEKISEVGRDAFSYCANLTEFKWPASCPKIPHGCFENSGIKTVTGIENVVFIDNRSFWNCTNLTEFCWPKRAVEINNCFAGSGIEKLTGTENVILIKAGAFMNCQNLKHFDFTEKMDVGSDSFRGSSIESVSNLKLMNSWTIPFRDCNNLSRSYKVIKNDFVALTYLDGSNIITDIEFLPACCGETVDMNDIPGIENLTIIKLNLLGEDTLNEESFKGIEYITKLIFPKNLINLPQSSLWLVDPEQVEVVMPLSVSEDEKAKAFSAPAEKFNPRA